MRFKVSAFAGCGKILRCPCLLMTVFFANFVGTMADNRFLKTIAGHEDDDFRQHKPEGWDIGECPLVSVWICAYNHEKYIRECLEGVVHQRTTFTYEVIVTDDCSTDSTQAVILEYAERYPTLIRPILGKRNLYSAGRKRLIEQFLPLARGKYISFCEGDDYWTYDGRLQALADFLETHPRHSMCFHAYRGLSEIEGLQVNYPRLRHSRNVGVFELLIEQHVQFAGLMGKRDVLVQDDELISDINSRAYNALDLRIYTAWLNSGKIYGSNKYWSIYRVHSEGLASKLLIKGVAEENHLRYLDNLSKVYNHRFKRLVKTRCEFVDLRKRLDQWTYSRRNYQYFKAIAHLIKAFLKYPQMFIYTYYHRYIH